jgi:hypothetical protein
MFYDKERKIRSTTGGFMAIDRSLTKIEMLSMELLIAVAQRNKRSAGHIMINREEQALAFAVAMAEWRMERAMGGFQINEKNRTINPREVSKKLGVNPTLKNLMDAHAEVLKQGKQ